jgi:hypothetical protein
MKLESARWERKVRVCGTGSTLPWLVFFGIDVCALAPSGFYSWGQDTVPLSTLKSLKNLDRVVSTVPDCLMMGLPQMLCDWWGPRWRIRVWRYSSSFRGVRPRVDGEKTTAGSPLCVCCVESPRSRRNNSVFGWSAWPYFFDILLDFQIQFLRLWSASDISLAPIPKSSSSQNTQKDRSKNASLHNILVSSSSISK